MFDYGQSYLLHSIGIKQYLTPTISILIESDPDITDNRLYFIENENIIDIPDGMDLFCITWHEAKGNYFQISPHTEYILINNKPEYQIFAYILRKDHDLNFLRRWYHSRQVPEKHYQRLFPCTIQTT